MPGVHVPLPGAVDLALLRHGRPEPPPHPRPHSPARLQTLQEQHKLYST